MVANITIYSTYVESEEFRGLIKGKLTVSADAETVGVVGRITADRGDLDLFGRRYQLDRAAVRFDGTTDPLLDVLITHDFPDVTTVTQVRGRLSKPELIMSSNPGIYSQGQLLGFLLGGEPSGDPQAGSARDKVTGAGASIIANKIGGYVRNALPVDIDVLKYEAASAGTSAAVTVGTWLSRSLFVAYRRHLEARPDENTGEGEAEYWLSRRVMVEAVVGDRGYNGIDLLWRKRY
jgi:translocation and assembly module TamB